MTPIGAGVAMGDKQQARERLRRLIDAYNSKDREALSNLYTDDISLWTSLGGSVTGKDEVLAHIDELFEKLSDERMTADTVITDGETIVVELTSTGSDVKGNPYEFQFTEVFELENGRFVRIRTYIDPDIVEATAG